MDYRKIIKEIGRGKNHARDLDRDTARGLRYVSKGKGKQRCSAFTKPCKITPSS